MATPQIPPRPARSNQTSEAADASEAAPIPQIPPRPAGRRHERSMSPERDRYAPSPLNAPIYHKPVDNNPYGSSGKSNSGSNLDLPRRPPSVSLPSIGQEGNEYESYSEYEAEPLSRTVSAMSATQTTHVGTDLPLHAPKPALSQTEARARVQGVTHSDNTNPSSPSGRRPSVQHDDKDPHTRALKSRSSAQFRSESAASVERPGSAQAEHHGIPQIGIQVPMYRHAGDVQAPSPAPQQQFFQDASGKPRHHSRRHSARDTSNPPDSYGRHGHGVMAQDKFEKDWYAKHPEALAQEGHYSHALNGTRREYVLSSDELNKLVRGSAGGAGFGTAPNVNGLPDEQIGYLASEEYASRMSSRPGSSYSNAVPPLPTPSKFDSPLRKVQSHDGRGYLGADGSRSRPDTADSEVIHVDAPEHHWSKVTGEGSSTPPVDLGPSGGNTAEHGGFIDEQGYGIPILASDEIRPESAWQRPAISPHPQDRRASNDLRNHFGSQPGSAGHSRPGSIHGPNNLTRTISHDGRDVHTPLDDVEEYEPLFADDDNKIQKPLSEAQRMKHRPDMKHRFPSQDIWEDSPDSARLEAEVGTPEFEEADPIAAAGSTSTFESPETEAARKGEVSETEKARLISKEQRLAESDFKPRIKGESRRPGTHRFPSSDIWEDSPDSARLETTVGDSDDEEANPAETAGAVVQTSANRSDLSGSTPREGATAGVPLIPARPSRTLKHKSSAPKEHSHLSEVYNAAEESSQLPIAEVQRTTPETRKAPSVPDRPKPQVPARPNRSDNASPSDDAGAAKTKPPVPARPLGGKIAALQAGFMSDLNNRLKLGPQAPAKPSETERSEDDTEEEKAPLEDARKGRARGPARRKPAAAPAAAATAAPEGKKLPKLSFAQPITVWHISPRGKLDVVYEAPEPPSEDANQQKSVDVTNETIDSVGDAHSKPVTKSADTPSVTAAAPLDEVPNSEQESFGVNPLPASSGPGNPVSVAAGEPLPPMTQSVNDKVTLDEASYVNSGAGTDLPSVSNAKQTESATQSIDPAQTGVKDIEVNPGTAGAQKLTVIEGGHPQTGEDVVLHSDTPRDFEGHERADLAGGASQ